MLVCKDHFATDSIWPDLFDLSQAEVDAQATDLVQVIKDRIKDVLDGPGIRNIQRGDCFDDSQVVTVIMEAKAKRQQSADAERSGLFPRRFACSALAALYIDHAHRQSRRRATLARHSSSIRSIVDASRVPLYPPVKPISDVTAIFAAQQIWLLFKSRLPTLAARRARSCRRLRAAHPDWDDRRGAPDNGDAAIRPVQGPIPPD